MLVLHQPSTNPLHRFWPRFPLQKPLSSCFSKKLSLINIGRVALLRQALISIAGSIVRCVFRLIVIECVLFHEFSLGTFSSLMLLVFYSFVVALPCLPDTVARFLSRKNGGELVSSSSFFCLCWCPNHLFSQLLEVLHLSDRPFSLAGNGGHISKISLASRRLSLTSADAN